MTNLNLVQFSYRVENQVTETSIGYILALTCRSVILCTGKNTLK